ncbi:MAG: hypothetical protein M1816_004470 [Peltula sp. TS41687]|nr:MAG: hypothetical protein M1816_004470 [Peltula sp. TS41687]
MAETSPTPNSGGESVQANRTPAPKDKHCPYCDQLFTSSSLGRHLDLYIKDKNPKPPDGIHDIDEIRKLRGGITRRSARSSSVRRESLTPAHPKPASVASSQRSPSDASSHPVAQEKPQFRNVNEPASWHHAGVIRDIPPTSQDLSRLDTRRDSVYRRYNVKSGVEHKEKVRDALDQGRAAELALREVLDSLKVAALRARPTTSPLPFDIFALTFPALVLQCLAPPPTLYATSPFPTVNSWSLDLPGEMQLRALVDWLRGQYRPWKREVSRTTDTRNERGGGVGGGAGYPGHRPREVVHHDGGRKPIMTAEAAQEQEDAVVKHALDAYNHWDLLPDKSKSDSWRLEILRAFSREKEKRQQVDIKLEEALQDVDHCKAQVDRLSRCQQPREYLMKTPTSMPVAKETLRELSGLSNTPISDWDFDRLLNKWKMVVQENRRGTTGMASQKPLSSYPPPPPPQESYQPPTMSLPSSSSTRLTNGANPSPSTFVRPAPLLPPPTRINEEDSADDNDEDMEDAPMEDGDGPTPVASVSTTRAPPPPTAMMSSSSSSRGSVSVEAKPDLNHHATTTTTTPMSVDQKTKSSEYVRPRGSLSVHINHPTSSFRGSIDAAASRRGSTAVAAATRMNDKSQSATSPSVTGGASTGTRGGG